jgi:hypothetical protein
MLINNMAMLVSFFGRFFSFGGYAGYYGGRCV